MATETVRTHNAKLRDRPWLNDPVLQKIYTDIHSNLVYGGYNATIASRAVTILAHFVFTYSGHSTYNPSILQTDESARSRAYESWQHLQHQCNWGTHYKRMTRRWLSDGLEIVCADLVPAVNPTKRKRTFLIKAHRSYNKIFTMHDCMPIAIRKQPESDPVYQLHLKVCKQFIATLTSTSRSYILSSMTYIHKYLFGKHGSSPWWPVNMSVSYESVMKFLCAQRTVAWIQRFSDITNDSSMGLQMMRRCFRILRILHRKIVHKSTENLTCLPIPSDGGILAEDGTALCGYSSGEGSIPDEKTEVTRAITMVTQRVLKTSDLLHEANRIYAFTPEEVYKITRNAVTTKEKLVVLLFLTTGMRIGGVCRIRVQLLPDGSISEKAITTEKNGKPRHLRLSALVRLLAGEWIHENGLPPSGLLFAHRHRNEDPTSTSTIWKLCRTIFTRADINGAHVHPHTFRHTVIKLFHRIGKGNIVSRHFFYAGENDNSVIPGIT